jgi:hypothetical protein
MKRLLTYEQLNETENVHATTRQIAAFKKAVEEEVRTIDDFAEGELDGERFARLKLMSRIYHDLIDALDKATGNVLDAFREQYVKYVHRIRGVDQPDKFPGAFIKLDDVDPVTAQVTIKRHP